MALAAPSVTWLSKPSTGYELFARPLAAKPSSGSPLCPSLTASTNRDAAAGPMRTIAGRGTEIFVAKGTEVRCADLQDLKARHPSLEPLASKEYKTLDLPDLNFNVRQLEVSKDGLLLAIVGEKELAVCMLPTEGFSRTENSKLRVPTFNFVGGNYYNSDKGSRIVRVIWHPLGVEGASLVVLTSDSIIRTFDFTIGQDFTFEIPEQTLDLYALNGLQRHAGGFFADEEEMEAASCCFGEGEQGWRPFTLYILMRGGDIYALTPLVPSRFRVSREYLHTLSLAIAADLDSLDDNATMADKLILRQQGKWVNSILSQESVTGIPSYSGTGGSSPRKKPSTCLTRPGVVGPSPLLQGPFLFNPVPPEISSAEYCACDVFHIEAGPVGVIGVLFSNGKLDLCLELDLLRAKWIDKKSRQVAMTKDRDLPIVAGYETIDLDIQAGANSPRTSWPVFSRDPCSNQVWFVNHNSGVVGFSMKAWLSKLATVLDDGEEDVFVAKSLAKTPPSVVYRTIDYAGRPYGSVDPVTGSTAVYEAYLGYVLIAATTTGSRSVEFDEILGRVSSDKQLIPRAPRALITAPTSHRASPVPRVTQSTPPAGDKPLQKQEYTIPPVFSARSPLKQLEEDFMRNHRPMMTCKVVLSTETNDALRRARDTLKGEYDSLMSAAQQTYDRAATQRIQLRTQLAAIHQASETLSRLRTRDVQARLRRFVERQEELQSRADHVLRTLIVKSQTGLSDAEKRWFKEVSKVQERIVGEDRASLATRMAMVKDMADQLCPVANEGGDTRRRITTFVKKETVPEEVRASGLRILNELLEKEDALIRNTRRKLEELAMDV